MGSVKKGFKKAFKGVKSVFKEAYEGSMKIGETLTGGMVKSPATKRKIRDAKRAAADANRPIPMPDEDALERERRRRSASRTSGRASTIYTDEDRLGP